MQTQFTTPINNKDRIRFDEGRKERIQDFCG